MVDHRHQLSGDLNSAGLAMSFHALSNVHRVAPNVVGDAQVTDHPGDNRVVMDADAQGKPVAANALCRLISCCISSASRQIAMAPG